MTISSTMNSVRTGVSKIVFEGGWEATYLDVGDSSKFVVCVSTMLGCPVRCGFCHLTELGMYRGWRKLSGQEIADQVVDTLVDKLKGQRLPRGKDCLVSFMGMGEPLMNIDGILESIPLIEGNAQCHVDGKFRYDMATMMPLASTLAIVPTSIQMRVFYSLHSAIQEQRDMLIPHAKTIEEAFDELVVYERRTSIRPIVNHTFIDKVNDTDDEVDAIVKLFKKPQHESFQLRLLRYNPFELGAPMRSNGSEVGTQRESRRLLEIIERLENHINVKIHRSLGYDVKGACGQFIGGFATRLESNRLALA